MPFSPSCCCQTLFRYIFKSKSTDEKKKKNPHPSLRERESRVMERVFMETGDKWLSFAFRSDRKVLLRGEQY